MKFKNFEIRKPTLLCDPPYENYFKYNFDLVKWEENHCFSIAFLSYNEEEYDFNFKSVGTRYLEYREEGLEEWLLQWCELKKIEYLYEEEKDA